MSCLACFWISGISSDKPVINNGSNLWKYEYLQKKNVTDKFSNNSIKYSPKGKNIAINWRKRIEKKPKKNQIEELHFMHIHVFFFCLIEIHEIQIISQFRFIWTAQNCHCSASFQGIKIECYKPTIPSSPRDKVYFQKALFNMIWILENILLFYTKCSTLTGLCYTLKKMQTLPN